MTFDESKESMFCINRCKVPRSVEKCFLTSFSLLKTHSFCHWHRASSKTWSCQYFRNESVVCVFTPRVSKNISMKNQNISMSFPQLMPHFIVFTKVYISSSFWQMTLLTPIHLASLNIPAPSKITTVPCKNWIHKLNKRAEIILGAPWPASCFLNQT